MTVLLTADVGRERIDRLKNVAFYQIPVNLAKLSLLAGGLLVATLFAWILPGFLFTEDPPAKSEAVVVFVGPGNESRLEEAKQLVKEGYARYLLIPAQAEVYDCSKNGEMQRVALLELPNEELRRLMFRLRVAAGYPKQYEATHIEALEAKRTMDQLGLHSALLVSSGYHMRRIRVIAARVFAPGRYAVRCNPARWQQPYTAADWLQKERCLNMVSEYVKLAWLLVYGSFC